MVLSDRAPQTQKTPPVDGEDTAQHTVAFWQTISRNLPGVVFQRVLAADGTLDYPFFSEGVRAILGFSPEEMRVTGQGCLDVEHWADRAEHMQTVRQSARTLQLCLEEFRAITRDGEVRWLRGTSQPRPDGNGGIRWDGVLIDVTESRRAEQTLQMVMDHAADSIITLDGEGRIVSVNAAVERLFGYSAAELAGQSVSRLLPDSFGSGHDEYIVRYQQTGEGRILEPGPRELVGRRKDGNAFPFEISTSEVRLEGQRLFIGIGRDITRRKETEAALFATEQRLLDISVNMPGIVFQRSLSPDGRIGYPYVSRAIQDILGLDPALAPFDSEPFLAAISVDMREAFIAKVHHSARTLAPLEDDLLLTDAGGGKRWMRSWSRPRRLADGTVMWDGVMLDVTDRKWAEEQLTYLAYHDPLTKAFTRAHLLERFDTLAGKMLKDGQLLALVSLGIDRFSSINTTLGHAVGDQLLIRLTERLFGCLNEGDVLARVGGDRFLLLLTGMPDVAEIAITVEQFMTRLRDPFALEDEEIEISACAGISIFPQDGINGETLARDADVALARAKAVGPGTMLSFVPEMNARASRTLTLQNRLRRALEREEFVPFYQPQVDLESGEIIGMEALVRWFTPDDGMISPADFIPVAEEFGLIDGICEQMLRACSRQQLLWREEGLRVVPVAVNISGRQFHQPKRLVQSLEAVLAETGLPPSLLELELTESSAMSDPQQAVSVISVLRERGLVCSIDDFGTGYSSLSVLKSFPIGKLKIDRSFVLDIASDPNDAAIVTAIVAMAHALKLKVVAEGVETQQHLEFLRNLGCDQIQGYFFSRPLPAAEMGRLLAEGRRLTLPTL